MSLIPDGLSHDEKTQAVMALLGVTLEEAERILAEVPLVDIGYDVFEDGKPYVGPSIFDSDQ